MKIHVIYAWDENGLTVSPLLKSSLVDFSIPETITFKTEDLKPKKDCWIVARVSLPEGEIDAIVETQPMNYLFTSKRISEIVSYNKIILEKMQKDKVTSNYAKPEDLFISDENWNMINSTVELGLYPLMIGPKGGGKTTTAQKVAEARGMDFYPINCGAIFKPKQTLIGQMHAKDGTTYLVPSEFLKYFTSEKPTLIFLDEISRIPVAAANYFMTILDLIQSYIYIEEEGRRVYKGKNVVFMAAANFGFEYSDTRNLDGALIDRFIKFMMDYLPLEEEVRLIKMKVPGVKETQIKTLVAQAHSCRENEKLRVTVSTRQLINMAKYLNQGYPVRTVLDVIFKNLFINGSMDDREIVEKMFDSKM